MRRTSPATSFAPGGCRFREQLVEIARLQCPALRDRQRCLVLPRAIVGAGEDILVLGAPVEPDQTPGKMVVHGGLRAWRDDQRRKGEAAVTGAIEEPGADPGAHPAVCGRLLILLGKPGLVGQQLGEMRPDRGQDFSRVIAIVPDRVTSATNLRSRGLSTTYSSCPVSTVAVTGTSFVVRHRAGEMPQPTPM